MLKLSTFGLSMVIVLVVAMMLMSFSTIHMCKKENKKLKFIEQDWARRIISDNQFYMGMTFFMMLYGIGCFVFVIISYIRH